MQYHRVFVRRMLTLAVVVAVLSRLAFADEVSGDNFQGNHGERRKYGTTAIFGTQENFEKYRVTDLVRSTAEAMGHTNRLILLGYGNFREEHHPMHALLEALKIPHEYRDGCAERTTGIADGWRRPWNCSWDQRRAVNSRQWYVHKAYKTASRYLL